MKHPAQLSGERRDWSYVLGIDVPQPRCNLELCFCFRKAAEGRTAPHAETAS
jgi:hypothetical protein